MKKSILICGVVALFISCKKDNNNPPLEEPFPHQWIFTSDASADKYVIWELAGNNMKRTEVLKTYNLGQLSQDKFCEFNVAESRTEFTNELCYTIQFENDRKRWLFAGFSSNGQEVHLGTTKTNSETADPGGDGYKFFIHKMPDVNGVKTITIESVDKPGYYISTVPPGFNYSASQLTLTQHSSPQSAIPWQCRLAN